MGENHLLINNTIALNTNHSSSKKSKVVIYEIMHMEKKVAIISSVGRIEIIDEKFMPYEFISGKRRR